MAQLDVASGLITDSAKVLEDSRDSQTPAAADNRPKDELDELTSWVVSRCRMWRDHRRSNYENLWDQYERLWRGLWAPEDKNRKSERSMLVTPGLAEAVENIVAEVEEALFGQGDSFDIRAPFGAQEDAKKIIDDNKARLKEDLGQGEFNPNVGEALINGAVYGSGIGEIIVETFTKREITASVQAAYGSSAPAPSPMADLGLGVPSNPQIGGEMPPAAVPMPPQAPLGQEIVAPAAPEASQMPPAMLPTPMAAPTAAPAPIEARVIEREVSYACMQSVNPRNFLIEPTARTVDKALGVAVEEYVGSHIINDGMRKGKYRQVDIGTSAGDTQLGADRQLENEYVFDKVHILRYYGLVPKRLLLPPEQMVDLSADSAGDQMGEALRAAESAVEDQTEVVVNLDEQSDTSTPSTEPIDTEMVEAYVFIANESICIKAMENPSLMKDRPIVAFPWDIVPGRFWGRGVCEKGLVPQRVMDAELRARIDALAYISAPMMGMDASRLPRGFQLTVKPGKSILTNGDPNTVLRPLHFGQLDQSTFNHSQQLDQMIQRATGSLDVIALAQKTGDNRSGAMSMMLSGIVKRHKRTLMNFIDRFYTPALRKILWRNMQYSPERYTPRNWDFVPNNTMGIIQREYESATLTQLLSSMDPQTPEYKMVLMGIIANTGLTARRDIIDMLKQSITTSQQTAAAQAAAAANPQTQALQGQLQQTAIQLQIAEGQAKIRELESRTNLQNVKAQNAQLEPQFRTAELATKGIYQVQADQQDREFKRRLDMADRFLKAKDIASNERIAAVQSTSSFASERVKAAAQVATARASQEKQPVPVPVPHPVPVPVLAGRSARLLA